VGWAVVLAVEMGPALALRSALELAKVLAEVWEPA